MTSQPNRLLQFFVWTHLPPHLADVSKPFADLAHEIDRQIPDNAEKTTALRKLLEAKDCAVRAVLYRDPPVDRNVPRGSTREADAARGAALRAEHAAARTIAEPGTAAAFDETTGTDRKDGGT